MKKNFTGNPTEMLIRTETPKSKPKQKKESKIDFEVPKGYELKKQSKSESMHLLVRPLTRETLQNKAEIEGKSLNQVVNEILEDYIERSKNE